MGLIKTALNSAGGALQDQFKEYITCDSLDASIIMKKGLKKTREKNVNNGMTDIITNGSAIQVADGQIAIVVTNGKVSDIIGEPGIFKYTNDQAAQTIFEGGFLKGLGDLWKQTTERFTYGAEPPKEVRVYYFNTKEFEMKIGNSADITVRSDKYPENSLVCQVGYNGNCRLKISNPMQFYINIAGNAINEYTVTQFSQAYKEDIKAKITACFSTLSENGDITISKLQSNQTIAQEIAKFISEDWNNRYGVIVAQFNLTASVDEEDKKALRDMDIESSNLKKYGGVQGAAMMNASKQNGGNMMGAMMGFGFGQQMMGAAMVGQQPQQNQVQGWTCSCGTQNTGKFCQNCGQPQPNNSSIKCPNCGTENPQGTKFCGNCGGKLN